MGQIKDSPHPDPPGVLRAPEPESVDARIASLLERRRRIADDLVSVDRDLAELRRAAGRASREPSPDRPEVLPLRGEDLASGAWDVPPGVDRDDLGRRLHRVIDEEHRAGRTLAGLELLAAYDPGQGRVLAIQTRRCGQIDWVPRFALDGRPVSQRRGASARTDDAR